MTASEPPPPPSSLGICEDEESTTSVGKAGSGESSKKAKKKTNKKAEKIIKKEKARRHEMIRVRRPLRSHENKKSLFGCILQSDLKKLASNLESLECLMRAPFPDDDED